MTECDVHDWRQPYIVEGHQGPLDGQWEVQACRHCNTISLRPLSGGDGLHLILARLKQLGCNPT